MENLRKEIKLLKALQGITYKEIAEHLEISLSGMYNFMSGQYNLSYQKAARLREIIDLLRE